MSRDFRINFSSDELRLSNPTVSTHDLSFNCMKLLDSEKETFKLEVVFIPNAVSVPFAAKDFIGCNTSEKWNIGADIMYQEGSDLIVKL